jgi:hypothetical protein
VSLQHWTNSSTLRSIVDTVWLSVNQHTYKPPDRNTFPTLPALVAIYVRSWRGVNIIIVSTTLEEKYLRRVNLALRSYSKLGIQGIVNGYSRFSLYIVLYCMSKRRRFLSTIIKFSVGI